MQFAADQKGFTLIELLIATLILVIGLVGAAAMQIQAMNGTFLASSEATGSSVAQAWGEWLYGLATVSDQQNVFYDNPLSPNATALFQENFVKLSELDTKMTDTMDDYNAAKTPPPPFTEYEMPRTAAELAAFFNDLNFRKAGVTASPFTAADMPPPAPRGAKLYLRIAANVPVVNTTTIEVAVLYTTGFVSTRNRGATLRLVIASNM